MNRPINSFSSAISIIICLLSELAFSSAFKQVYSFAGNGAWLSVLIAGAAVTLLIPIAIRGTFNRLFPVIGFLYIVLLMHRLAVSMALLKENSFILMILIATAVFITASACYGLRGAVIFSALCFVPIVIVLIICFLLGLKDYSFEYLTPMFDSEIYGVLIGSFNAFSLVSILLLPMPLIDTKHSRAIAITCALSTIALSCIMLLGSMTFGVTAEQYSSVVSEISKNVSVGKFFKRLEGLADAAYILTATVSLTLISAITLKGNRSAKNKALKPIIVFLFSVIGAIVAYYSISNKAVFELMKLISVCSGVGVVLCIILSIIKKKKTVIALAIVQILMLCSCNATGEIENQTYVVITFWNEKTNSFAFVTENGSETEYYSVKADDINEATKLLETNKSLTLSFEQMGLLMLSVDSDSVLSWAQMVIGSNIPNSAGLCFYIGNPQDIYDNQISKKESAFEYVSLLMSSENIKHLTISEVNTILQNKSSKQAFTLLLDKNGCIGSVGFNKRGVLFESLD